MLVNIFSVANVIFLPRGGAEKVQTPSFKVVEVNESSPEQVLLFVPANWKKRERGGGAGGADRICF